MLKNKAKKIRSKENGVVKSLALGAYQFLSQILVDNIFMHNEQANPNKVVWIQIFWDKNNIL